ncbi:cell division protein FtsA [Candidatus Pelagibacter sp.]|nr:cell division protein FtsA [Candidatus Pelagibacter sp.]
MDNKNFQIYFDCGSSKIRAAAFNKEKKKEIFYKEDEFLPDHSNLYLKIKDIISYLEKNTNEYIDDVNLMIDSPKTLSIGISISKSIDNSQIKNEDIQFLIQDAKQQLLKYYTNLHIAHIIIKKYIIDGIDYTFLPHNIESNLISLDIFFICLPKERIEYFKNFFFNLDISIGHIYCTSYAKSINYKDHLSSIENVSFIDIGYDRTSVTGYINNEINFFDTLPIGGNHISKDISKILKIDLEQANNIKLFSDTDQNFLNKKNFSLELVQKIIFARTEEILELCSKSIKSNLNLTKLNQFKMIFMGEGSKILDKKFKEKISFSNSIDFLEETTEDICQSGLKLSEGSSKQEVVIIPRKQIKQGFFEKLFHFFK